MIRFPHTFLLSLALLLLLVPAPARADLKPETSSAYAEYITALDARMDAQNHATSGFLWLDRDPARRASVHNGSIATEEIRHQDLPGGGMLQHWVGAVFLPGATIERVRQIDQDYADYAKFYAPDLSRPRILQHPDPNHYLVSYRIRKKQVITVVEDTTHTITYTPLGPNRLAERSASTSVRQVEDAGTPSEHALDEGKGEGFLWAMNSYWRLEQRDGGVYVECEAVTLSRDVPLGMGHMIGPVLRGFAEDSLKTTLEQKRRAVIGGK